MVLETLPDPVPLADEVLVKIEAVGVNPVDTYIRSGNYARMPKFPYIPGSDGAGVIESVGSGVTDFSVGDRVYMVSDGLGLGAYAEKIACPKSNIARIPDGISFEQAAAINIPYATAHRALNTRGAVRAGDKVLIHGASGGVGIAAVQMAAAAGATVFATAGSERGLRLVEDNGARYCFNHSVPGYMSEIRSIAPKGIDLVIENLANANLDADLEILATFGRIVVVGSRGRLEIDPRMILQKDAVVCGMALWNATAAEISGIHKALFIDLAAGVLKPVVGKRFSLAEAKMAHEAIFERGAFGKIVLLP